MLQMDAAISSVRTFNRFFTKYVGALNHDFLDTGMTLAEARVLFEIAHRQPCFADDLQQHLDLDAGFLSRVLGRFERRGWIKRVPHPDDQRRRGIRLSSKGLSKFRQLDGRQRAVIEQNLQRLDGPARHRLTGALDAARGLLEGRELPAFTVRTFRAGDMGLIACRQSLLYRERYGWNSGIEVNVGEVTAAFLRNFKPGREQCWVAEVDGQVGGSVFLTDEGGGASRLRLLYVEPAFQGRGIGGALVESCLTFARSVGYARMTLWTQSILEGARHIYAKHGFRIVDEKDHSMFGVPLRGETWELDLTQG